MALRRKWYTDLVDIYRVVDVQDGNLTKKERQPVATGVPCRIYQSAKPSPAMKSTAAEVQFSDRLLCAPDVDVRTGDELHVTRGANLPNPPARQAERYFAGAPTYYDRPARLAHQEISIFQQERIGN